MRQLILCICLVAIAAALAYAESGLINENIRVLNQPFKVVLQLNRLSAFVMPGPIQSTRLPVACVKNFSIEADQGSNILYVSPIKEMKQPCSLFIVVGEAPYEFTLTVSTFGDYQHQIIVGEPPVETAKRKEVEAVTKKFEAERAGQKVVLEKLISTIRQGKKIKETWRAVFAQGPLIVRVIAEIGDHSLLETNVPEQAFNVQSGELWLYLDAGNHRYVLTSARKFAVMDKEVKL
jgi:hypothetical protein